MRVLMATDFYPPYIGGTERQVEVLSRELARRGHEVHVATVWQPGLAENEDERGVEIHRLKGASTAVPWFSADPQRRYHPPAPDPAVAWRLRRLLTRIKPALVHAHGWIAYSCAIARLGTNVPLLVSVRDHGYICAIRVFLHKGAICSGPAPAKCLDCAAGQYSAGKATAAVAGVYAGRVLLKRSVASVHSISTYIEEVNSRYRWSRRHSSDQAMIHDIIGTSFDELEMQPALALRLPAEPYILFVGALQRHKGIYDLLAAYERIQNRPPLVLIGTPWPDSPKEFPEGVTVLYNVPHSAVMKAWENSLFGVAPSASAEALGDVIAEAMTKGKPVVGTAVGGIPDLIIDGQTGLLVPLGDVATLTAGMVRLIEDSELRERLGRNARHHVRALAADSVIPRFEALYQRITQGAPVRKG